MPTLYAGSRRVHLLGSSRLMATDQEHGGAGLVVGEVDLMPLARISDETLRQHGVTARGAGWSSEDSQHLHFAMLVRAAGLRGGDAITVNDLGCGYGALYDHLVRSGIEVVAYNGYDISAEMLDAARARLPADRVHLERSARLSRNADFSFLSGSLNHKTSDDEAWRLYARTIVRDLAAHSRRGLAFNMMSTNVTYRVEQLFYADPAEWLEWCRREIAPNLELVEDYPLWEWTIGGTLG